MGLTFDIRPLRTIADRDGLTPEMAQLWNTATDPAFPGAVLPVRSARGELTVYAVAGSHAEWRKLQPLLKSFAGPLLTDFSGSPRGFDMARPFDAALGASGIAIVAALRPGLFADSESVALRALLRLQDRLSAAPVLVTPRPKSTSRLLAELQDSLNAGDLSAADDALGVLRNELRLDAANLARLEMQLLAAGGQWSALRWHPRFETLVYGNPPPESAKLLLEAIYRVQVEGVEADARTSDLIVIAPLVSSLLPRVLEPLSEAALWFRDWLAPPASDQDQEDLAEVAVRSPSRVPSSPSVSDPEPGATPPDFARSALMVVMASSEETYLEAAVAAYDAVDCLSEAQRADLLHRPVFKAIWDELTERLGHARPPSNWTDWLLRLSDPTFDAAAVASNGNPWALGQDEVDPVAAQAMAQAILATQNGLATDRLAEGIPFIVAWAQADPRWPRTSLRSVYLSLLTAMAVSGRSGDALLKSAAPLLDGALRSGLLPSEYREALDAAGEIVRAGLNRNSIYEILELAETALGAAPVVPEALQAFTFSILNEVVGQASRLTEGQRLAIGAIAKVVGWSHPLLTDRTIPIEATDVDGWSGLEVGIYTLAEGAARTAEQLLQTLHPGIRVTLNHDHGGTSSLAAMAQRADLFVIAWGAATHAATDFIRARRTGRIAYAAGKGASSLLRAIEEIDPSTLT